jgi:hypothetical protein
MVKDLSRRKADGMLEILQISTHVKRGKEGAEVSEHFWLGPNG